MKKEIRIITTVFILLLLNSCGSSIKTVNTTTINSKSSDSDQETEKDILFANTIYFDFNSSKVTKNEYRQNLILVKRYLSEHKDKTITLNGYCDKIGKDKYNFELGLKRAKEVKNILVSLGVDENRIGINSFGKVISSSDNEEIRKFNRKVIISINK
ncbi:MAG: OmpA family protein [Endomicrobium sp.]|jgi:outer membrane protein OmpA-like peptidoglycan-associated protein|nr:OmpA family protein [Endomicrobium sp.]